jgi:RimJ/RimL family protein N-acetyltransferase
LDAIATDRLALRPLTEADDTFVLELLNDPSWLRYIGDRGVHTLQQAREYVRNGPMAMHARHGFGLDAVVLRESGLPIGICGLIRRDTLDDVDIGFAFLPAYCGLGYAREAATAVLRHAGGLGLQRIVAITVPANAASIRLLESIGFQFERMLRMRDDPDELRLYACSLQPYVRSG